MDRDSLQKAFTLAHNASQDGDVPAAMRARFRAIAHLIWRSQVPRMHIVYCAECGLSKSGLMVESAILGISKPICCEVVYGGD